MAKRLLVPIVFLLLIVPAAAAAAGTAEHNGRSEIVFHVR